MAGAPRWYVVHARPRLELTAELNLGAQGFATFLPAVWKTVRHARQFRTVRVAFFPRYLFVRLDLAQDRWRSVNGTFGVSHLVMEGDRPTPVQPGIVEDLMALTGPDRCIAAAADLVAGGRVEILTGPFAGCFGELARLDEGSRVRVLLDLLGGRVPLDLAVGALAPAA
jgi:transcriptional antiterminator RfaH